MITVQQLRRAKGIEGYYASALSEGASEYYASQRGVWYGKGAARIQLPGDFTEGEIRVFCKRTAQINELEETHRSELQKRTTLLYGQALSVVCRLTTRAPISLNWPR